MNTQTQNNNQNVIFSETLFTNSLGEKFSLQEISGKDVLKIKIMYLANPKKVRQSGIFGYFKKKQIIQEERELIIAEEKITFHIQTLDLCSIRFSSKEGYESLNDYDENTIFKRYIMTLVNPYQINFHPGNILEIDWK